MPLRLNFKRSHRYDVSSKGVSVVPIYTLDNTALEYTVSGTTTGRDAIEFVAQRLEIDDLSYFGFRYESWSDEYRWLILKKSIKKQLDKHARQHVLIFGVMFFIENPQFIPRDIIRRQFYFQLRQQVASGEIPLAPKQAIKLCAYCLQADFGDFVDCDTTLERWQERPPICESSLRHAADLETVEHGQDIIWGYFHLRGVSQVNAQWYFIDEVRRRPYYGAHVFKGANRKGVAGELGVSRNGISVTEVDTATGQKREISNLRWEEMKDVSYNKKSFFVQRLRKSKPITFTLPDQDHARYLLAYCKQIHSFYFKYWAQIRTTPPQPTVHVPEPPDIIRGITNAFLSKRATSSRSHTSEESSAESQPSHGAPIADDTTRTPVPSMDPDYLHTADQLELLHQIMNQDPSSVRETSVSSSLTERNSMLSQKDMALSMESQPPSIESHIAPLLPAISSHAPVIPHVTNHPPLVVSQATSQPITAKQPSLVSQATSQPIVVNHASLVSQATSQPIAAIHPSLVSQATSHPIAAIHPSFISQAISHPITAIHPSLVSQATSQPIAAIHSSIVTQATSQLIAVSHPLLVSQATSQPIAPIHPSLVSKATSQPIPPNHPTFVSQATSQPIAANQPFLVSQATSQPIAVNHSLLVSQATSQPIAIKHSSLVSQTTSQPISTNRKTPSIGSGISNEGKSAVDMMVRLPSYRAAPDYNSAVQTDEGGIQRQECPIYDNLRSLDPLQMADVIQPKVVKQTRNRALPSYTPSFPGTTRPRDYMQADPQHISSSQEVGLQSRDQGQYTAYDASPVEPMDVSRKLLINPDIHQLLAVTNIQETELTHRLLTEYRQTLRLQQSYHSNSVSTPNLAAINIFDFSNPPVVGPSPLKRHQEAMNASIPPAPDSPDYVNADVIRQHQAALMRVQGARRAYVPAKSTEEGASYRPISAISSDSNATFLFNSEHGTGSDVYESMYLSQTAEAEPDSDVDACGEDGATPTPSSPILPRNDDPVPLRRLPVSWSEQGPRWGLGPGWGSGEGVRATLDVESSEDEGEYVLHHPEERPHFGAVTMPLSLSRHKPGGSAKAKRKSEETSNPTASLPPQPPPNRRHQTEGVRRKTSSDGNMGVPLVELLRETGERSVGVSRDEKRQEMAACLSDPVRLNAEFDSIPWGSVSASCCVAASLENRARNRSRDILPYDQARVKIQPYADNPSGYVNAAHVKVDIEKCGRRVQAWFITAQAPLMNTVRDFWAMVWEGGIAVIAMLAGEASSGLTQYLPSKEAPLLSAGEFLVKYQWHKPSGRHVETCVEVSHRSRGCPRSVYHFSYLDWTQGDVPSSLQGFTDFLDNLTALNRHLPMDAHQPLPGAAVTMPTEGSRPVLVHCESGAGATGMTVLYLLMRLVLEHNLDHSQHLPDLLASLRATSGMRLVQNLHQYAFVYRALLHYLDRSRLI